MTRPFDKDHPEQIAYDSTCSMWLTEGTNDHEKYAYRDGHHAGWLNATKESGDGELARQAYAAGRAAALEDAAPEDEPVEITELMQLVYDYADAFHDRLERIDTGDHHNILPMKAIQIGIRDQIRDQLALLYAPKEPT